MPEETHYVRIRMIGPEDDATVIASTWTDTIVIEAKPPSPPAAPNPLPNAFQKTRDNISPIKAPAASAAASHTSGDLPVASQSCQHSSAIPKQAQKASNPHGNPVPPLPNAPCSKNPHDCVLGQMQGLIGNRHSGVRCISRRHTRYIKHKAQYNPNPIFHLSIPLFLSQKIHLGNGNYLPNNFRSRLTPTLKRIMVVSGKKEFKISFS